jgi:NAD(P)-dependent dehydrogenase (short-subunit alcohol dehydrogenase family)
MPPRAAADIPRRLAGKVALVTGAARGIGLAIAKRLGAEGAAVILSDIDADVVAVSATSLSALGLAHDIADPSSSARVMGAIDQRFGRLDILVNNAAVLDASPWDALDFDQYRRVMDVNLDGALRVTMAAVPLIERCGGGSILNIASIMGVLGSRASIPYSTAKGGIVNLTRCLACDLGEKGIRVNAIAPGFIDTRMARLPDGSHEHATEFFQQVYLGHGRIPARRAGQPDDIAGPASFLVSDDAAYVTGQILMVDGGVSATF